MKLVHLLFVGYVAALTVYPCFEADCRDECLATEQEASEEPQFCSPFCTSTCCYASVYLAEVTLPARPALILSDKKLFYEETFGSTVLAPIWQPPD